MLPERIALFGHAYSGKSSIAQKLVDNYGYTRLSFAMPLKRSWIEKEISRIYGRETTKAERRRIYKLLADFVKSEADYDFFIKKLDRVFKNALVAGDTRFVIDDVRFMLEARWCELNLFTLVYVDTREETLKQRALANGEDIEELYNHISEAQIPLIARKFRHITVSGEGNIDEEIKKIENEASWAGFQRPIRAVHYPYC